MWTRNEKKKNFFSKLYLRNPHSILKEIATFEVNKINMEGKYFIIRMIMFCTIFIICKIFMTCKIGLKIKSQFITIPTVSKSIIEKANVNRSSTDRNNKVKEYSYSIYIFFFFLTKSAKKIPLN